MIQEIGTRPDVLPGGRLHNPDYVKFAPSVQCGGPAFELPGEAAAGEGLAAVAGPSPALCQPRTGQRNWGPVPPNSSTSVQPRISDIKLLLTSPASTLVLREHPAALCPLGGSARYRTSAVQQSWPAHVRHRSSKVWLRRAQPGRYSSRPCESPPAQVAVRF